MIDLELAAVVRPVALHDLPGAWSSFFSGPFTKTRSGI